MFHQTGEQLAARYILSGGPEDLVMDHHAAALTEQTDAPELPLALAAKPALQKNQLQP
jgi:hypothetical protein